MDVEFRSLRPEHVDCLCLALELQCNITGLVSVCAMEPTNNNLFPRSGC